MVRLKKIEKLESRIIQIVLLIIFTFKIADLHQEQALINHLTKNMSRYARPVFNFSNSIQATIGIELAKLEKVDDRDQKITTEVWMRQNWFTDIFKWDPKEWNGITYIQLDAQNIWSPDIVLLNSADEEFAGGPSKYKTLIDVYHDGRCTWLAPATFTSSCSIKTKEFPFDEQTCTLQFLSWRLHRKILNLSYDEKPLITKNFVNSTEWDITGALKYRKYVDYECCEEPFAVIEFEFILRRKYLYYVFNIIVPCFLLVLAVLFGFFLHPESGERISLTITILLAISVFLQLVSESLPRNSDSIPMLAVFYMVMMAESVVSLIATCVVLAFHHKSADPDRKAMPRWMRKLFIDYLGKIFCICSKEQRKIKQHKTTASVLSNECLDSSLKNNNISMEKRQNNHISNLVKQIQSTKNETLSASILNELIFITSSMKDENEEEAINNEWKLLAKVIDRLYFWFFFITLISSTALIIIPAYSKHN